MSLLPVHIISGSIAIISGYIAIFAFKGARLHRNSGAVFSYAMIGLGLTGAIMAIFKSQPGNIIGGFMAIYLATTGALTFRGRDAIARYIDGVTMVGAVLLAFYSISLGFRIMHSPTGRLNGIPPHPLFVFGALSIVGAIGDLRLVITNGIRGAQRVARHLWRMSFAMFIATGSFFLGQAKVIPKPIRILPVLIVLAALPLVLLLYWLMRVSFTKWYRLRSASFRTARAPSPIAVK